MNRALLAATSLSMSKLAPHLQQRADVEAALPVIMSNLIFAALGSTGYTFRKDIVDLLAKCAQAEFGRHPDIYRGLIADKTADEASMILKAAGEDDVRTVWVAVHHLILKLVALGIDVSADLRLIAAGVETEIQLKEERYGSAQRVYDVASRMENEARRRGWWPQLGKAAPAAIG